MKLPILFFVLIMCFCVKELKGQTSFVVSCNVQDSLALVDIYNQTNGPNWDPPGIVTGYGYDSWLKEPVYRWLHVQLDSSGRVIVLNLAASNLKGGSIPASLGKLTKLTYLDLDRDQLTGNLPAFLGNLTNLTELGLEFNQFTGSIPTSFKNLSNLNDLYLNNNLLTGSIPSLSNLRLLNVSQNQLRGSIPLFKCSVLILYNNDYNFSGLEDAYKDVLTVNSSTLNYFPQNIILKITKRNNILSVSAGGTPKNDTYQWYKNSQLDSTKVGDSTYVANDSGLYNVVVTNSIVTDLALYSDTTSAGIDVNLRNLVLSNGTLAPIFNTNFTNYTALVSSSVSSISVIPTLNDPACTLTVNGAACTNGSASAPIPLIAGSNNSITIVVTSQDGTTINTYTVNVTMLNISLINPLPSMVDKNGNLSTDVKKIDTTALVKGTSTDGVSDILLVANSTVPITYSLNRSSDGSLSTLLVPNKSTSVTVQPVNGLAVAVYTPPDGYGASNPSNRSVAVNAHDPNNNSTSVNIKLVTPPVLLIHGMWSKPQQWIDDNFYSYLFTNGFQKNLYLVDYSQYNANTFDPLNDNPNTGSKPARDAINKEIKQAIQNGAANGIIVTQVDVVGHSLGGLQARSFSQDVRFLSPNLNYNKGYFHKLITIGTPHLGSEWGPILYYSDYYIARLPLLSPQTKIAAIAVKDLLLLTTNHPVGTCHLDFDPSFKVDGTGLINLTATTLFKVKVHTIEAQYDAPAVVLPTPPWAKFLGIMSRVELHTPLNATLNFILKGNASDVVVPQYSQLGGLQSIYNDHYNFTTHSSILPVPLDFTETNNPDIQLRVRNLLLSDDSTIFATGFPSPNNVSTPFDNVTNNPFKNSNDAYSGTAKQNSNKITVKTNPNQITNLDAVTTNYSLQITSPAPSVILNNSGTDSLTLTLQFTNPPALANALFMVQGVGFFNVSNSTPYSTKILLPKTITAGRLKIAALGNDTAGNIYADTLSITVQSSDTLKSLTINTGQIQLDSLSRIQNISVTGLFTNGRDTTYRDITSGASGTQYSTLLNNTISAVTADGQVNGIKAGTDTIIIKNQSITVKIPVVVNPDMFQVVKYTNSINLNLNDQILGNPPFVLNGTATSGGPITYNLISGPASVTNGIVTVNDTGLVKLVARSPADAYFNAAPNDTVSFTVLKFPLPVANFKIAITSATCRGSFDGIVNITASDNLNYTATITGNGLNAAYPFTNVQTIDSLSAGSYSLCITVVGQSSFRQCYNIVITQPQDLSVYTTISGSTNSINLALNGGASYNIQLNGQLYTTSNNTITLPLKYGNNDLVVSTDRVCQGKIEKLINTSGNITPYPVPFRDILNLNIGNTNINKVVVEIHDVQDGRLVYSNQYANQSGVLRLDLSNLNSGIYALHLVLDNSESIFKVTKQ